ncbi:polyphosphate:AMP phosphotransferase [Polymorphum gilvum]|uniref:Polyphosphate kinase 2 family n=1 Tax=Polymorphum gilvum (strain LMG 25793 / CGMCC 1.9160 / SL003B-26A1) TaxID=991905 RepID=F2IVG4_POLGS|nr:polyphosphate:AMP phosphotransferase [Polymorphum gilvum]ADZ72682.1 Polyphosphate kinase 2 family [Polymorphum gilvum SL003B-26A1]
MFQSATLPQKLDKATFAALEPDLRRDLLAAQLEIIEKKPVSTIVLVAGIDGAGKGAAIARLYEWMDPRHLLCNAYGEPGEEERLRPPFWRYWRDLPAKGQTAIVFGSWYQAPMRARIDGSLSVDGFERQMAAIVRFEQMLASEGVLLLKFWFALSRETQKKRLKALKARGATARHVLDEWTGVKNHDKARAVAEQVALHTSTAFAPWVVLPSEDAQYRDAALAQTVTAAMRKALDAPDAPPPAAPAVIGGVKRISAVDAIDLSPALAEDAYEAELTRWQGRLAALVDRKAFRDIALVCAFQGNDAAGKGGTIRRVTRALDPRFYKVHPIAAPSDEERARPYLWRFWRRMPRKGHVALFDRSWYERVLVERVEGFAREADWMRAYNEINAFEAELTDFGIVLCKFWLAVSADEQLARFKAREETDYKRHKLTDDDWRNRLKWDQYAVAAGDMVDRTSTAYAPWTLVSSQDKRHARIAVLKAICKRLEKAL